MGRAVRAPFIFDYSPMDSAARDEIPDFPRAGRLLGKFVI